MKQQELTLETTVSPIVYLMQNYVDYNLWANATLVNWLRNKPIHLLEQDVPSSFPSIKLTMMHIRNVQQYWLSVIQGNEERFDDFIGSPEDAFTSLVEQSLAFADSVNAMADDMIQERSPVLSPWFQCDFPNFEYIIQCINHSTYHRGQVITIAHNLGLTDAPNTDYNFYNIHGK